MDNGLREGVVEYRATKQSNVRREPVEGYYYSSPTAFDPPQYEVLLGLEGEHYVTRPGASRTIIDETTTGLTVQTPR